MRILRNAAAAGAIVALGTMIATSSAQAALQTLTVNIDRYASAVDHTPGKILATVTISDLAGGGVSVDLSLDKAIYFASTGGPHITFAFNLDKSISFDDLTFSNPSKSDFTFVLDKNAARHLAPSPMASTGPGTERATILPVRSISTLPA